MAADEGAAEAITGRLTVDIINRELAKAGLPSATVLEDAIPTLTSSSTSAPELSVSKEENGDIAVASSSSFFSTPVLLGGSLGLVIVLGIVACFCHWKCKKRSTAPSLTSDANDAPSYGNGHSGVEMGNLGTRPPLVDEVVDLVSDRNPSAMELRQRLDNAGFRPSVVDAREGTIAVAHGIDSAESDAEIFEESAGSKDDDLKQHLRQFDISRQVLCHPLPKAHYYAFLQPVGQIRSKMKFHLHTGYREIAERWRSSLV